MREFFFLLLLNVTALFQLQLLYNVGQERMIIVNEQITNWKVTIVTNMLAFVLGDEGKS
jgi:hypothetical protein